MLSIELQCSSCGEDLIIETSEEAVEFFRVRPCATCLSDEYDSGYEDGKDAGYDEGYDEGYETGQEDCE